MKNGELVTILSPTFAREMWIKYKVEFDCVYDVDDQAIKYRALRTLPSGEIRYAWFAFNLRKLLDAYDGTMIQVQLRAMAVEIGGLT